MKLSIKVLSLATLIVMGSSATAFAKTTTPTFTQPTLAPPAQILNKVYTTGYSSYDNTPRGSLATFLNGISGKAGGTGTYNDPTTLAVGHTITKGKDVGDFAYGTKFYVPDLRKYFVAQDTCGDGSKPQNTGCHSLKDAPKGATLWLDLYVGASTNKAVLKCEDTVTNLHTVVINPPSNLAVVSGSVYPTCYQSPYGDLVTFAP